MNKLLNLIVYRVRAFSFINMPIESIFTRRPTVDRTLGLHAEKCTALSALHSSNVQWPLCARVHCWAINENSLRFIFVRGGSNTTPCGVVEVVPPRAHCTATDNQTIAYKFNDIFHAVMLPSDFSRNWLPFFFLSFHNLSQFFLVESYCWETGYYLYTYTLYICISRDW